MADFKADGCILTGSLTEVAAGSPFIIDGTNITSTIDADGAITINSAAGTTTADVGWTAPGAGKIATTGSLHFDGTGATGGPLIAYEDGSNTFNIRFKSGDSFTVTQDASSAPGYSQLVIDNSAVVFNQPGWDRDFRVESNTKAGMILVDSGTDQLLLASSAETAAAAGLGTDVRTRIEGTKNIQGSATKGVTEVMGDLVTSGSLMFFGTHGISNSPSCRVSANTTSFDRYWIQIAECQKNVQVSDTIEGQFMVSIIGAETNADHDADNTFLVTVKFSGNSAPPFFGLGTYVTVDTINSDNMEDSTGSNQWDPATDVVVTVNANDRPEVWIRASESYKHCYVSIIGGSNNEDPGSYVSEGFKISPASNWSIAPANLGGNVFGRWASKRFNNLQVEGDISSTSSAAIAISIGAAGVVFNEDSNAANDFRVETGTQTHAFFIDAGIDRIQANVPIQRNAQAVFSEYITAGTFAATSADVSIFDDANWSSNPTWLSTGISFRSITRETAVATSGRFTTSMSTDTIYSVNVCLGIHGHLSSANVFDLYATKNGSEIYRLTGLTAYNALLDPHEFTMNFLVGMTPTQYLEFWIDTPTSTAQMTVKTASVSIHSI